MKISVLILTDFSKNAWNALAYAAAIFANQDAQFDVLYIENHEQVLQTEHEELVTQGTLVSQVKTTDQKLQKLGKSIYTHFPKLASRFRIFREQGGFVDTIRQHVENHQIQYIIMGTKGWSMPQATLGSHAATVITQVKCPVFIIPQKAKPQLPKEVLLPTDFNSFYQHKVMRNLLQVLNWHKAALNILYVFKKQQKLTDLQERHQNMLRMYLHGIPHQFLFQRDKTLENAVQTTVETHSCSLIALPAKHLNLFEHILFSPETEKISYPETTPFLVLHA